MIEAAPVQVVELRQYTLQPGQREAFIRIFEEKLLDPHEATGMRVLGLFRDLDAPDKVVWLRGHADMPSRKRALTEYYDGPIWREHRAETNATIVDSDDVLLLRPAATILPSGSAAVVAASIVSLTPGNEASFPALFEKTLRPALVEAGASPFATFVSEHAENNFPRHPVREGERVFVWLSAFPSIAAHEAYRGALAASPAWKEVGPVQHLRLAPTKRSPMGAGLPGYTLERTGQVTDFDFLAGTWDVTNRRLTQRGVSSDEWDTFPARSVCWRHLGGVANVDEIAFPTKGWSGMTLRTFDLERKQWSIFWINSRTGKLFPAVAGGFSDGRGEFYGEDDDDGCARETGGRPVKVRFVWTRDGSENARWEQAFSYDGLTWEVNWTMDMKRTGPAEAR